MERARRDRGDGHLGEPGTLAPGERPLLALLFSLAASLGFSGMGIFVKEISREGLGIGTPETMFFRGLFGFALGLLVHGALRRPLRVSAPGVLVLRVLSGTVSLACYYGAIEGAVSDGPGELATASLLLKTAPVWVVLGAGFILGERADRRTWIALAVGVAGATIALVGPTGAAGRGPIVLGLLSGIFAAGAYLAVRRLAASEDPLTVVTLFSGGVALLTGPLVAGRLAGAGAWPSGRAFLLLGGVSFCGTAAQYLMTHAYRHSKAAIVAVSGLAEVAFTVVASVFFFGERPSVYSWVGGGLAVAAGLVATWPRRR